MGIMTVVMPVSSASRPVAPIPMAHCHAALRAQLRPLGHHAPGHFPRIRNEVGTKPHSIRGASLTSFGRALLSGSAADSRGSNSDEQKSGRQDRPAGDANHTQHFIVSSWVRTGLTARERNLEHDAKTENQFSENIRPGKATKEPYLAVSRGQNARSGRDDLVRTRAKPRGARADSRGLASGHWRTVLSVSSAVLFSNARPRQNVPSGMVKTISPTRSASRACTAACSMGPIVVRPPINNAAARSTRKSDNTTARRVVLARCSCLRLRDDAMPTDADGFDRASRSMPALSHLPLSLRPSGDKTGEPLHGR